MNIESVFLLLSALFFMCGAYAWYLASRSYERFVNLYVDFKIDLEEQAESFKRLNHGESTDE